MACLSSFLHLANTVLELVISHWLDQKRKCEIYLAPWDCFHNFVKQKVVNNKGMKSLHTYNFKHIYCGTLLHEREWLLMSSLRVNPVSLMKDYSIIEHHVWYINKELCLKPFTMEEVGFLTSWTPNSKQRHKQIHWPKLTLFFVGHSLLSTSLLPAETVDFITIPYIYIQFESGS